VIILALFEKVSFIPANNEAPKKKLLSELTEKPLAILTAPSS